MAINPEMKALPSERSLEALSLLIEGNRRFMAGLRSVDGTPSPARLRELAKNGQRPFCLVLSCSDSRVPAEIVFDRGLGDLFLVRVAGNTVGEEMIASLEFAALSFDSPVLVVMGHTGCGAIQASIEAHRQGDDAVFPSPYVRHLVDHIRPAVEACDKDEGLSGDHDECMQRVTWANVDHSIEVLLHSSEVLKKLVKDGRIMVVGSVFDLDSSRAEFFVEPEVSDWIEKRIRERLTTAMAAVAIPHHPKQQFSPKE